MNIKGFTLPELLLAMAAGSMLLLSVGQVYPQIHRQTVGLLQHYRLEQALWQTVFQLGKDLRRAGFCRGGCHVTPISLGAYPGEQKGSCVLIRYDLNLNGKIEGSGEAESEVFAYRLRQTGIETQRGVNQCQGGGWENLLDTKEIAINHFHVQEELGFYALQLSGYWRDQPQSGLKLEYRVRRENRDGQRL